MDFEKLLQASVRIHGHLCPGQVLGVKMAVLGLKEAEIEDPKGNDRKSVMVIVETDRCATDAVQSVTGCSLGRRTMKFVDYGKMAATFVNLKTGKAVRVLVREDSRQKAKKYFPDIENKHAAQLKAYAVMSDAELFDTMAVNVRIRQEDMPGRPMGRIRCDLCREYVQDRREIHRDGKILCRACAGAPYYSRCRSSGEDFF